MQLTEGQQGAKEAITAFLADPDPANSEFVLVGYAGTGKTFIMNHVLDDFQHRQIIACTIAHSAKNILIENVPDYVECYTLAQALGMRQQFSKGKEVFVVNKNIKSKPIQGKGIVIIDECSMISADLLRHIREGVDKDGSVKIIFSGDSAQLPPVSEDAKGKDLGNYQISPTFSITNKFVLTEIVRYGALIGTVGEYYRNLIEYLESGGNKDAVIMALNSFMPNWNDGKEMVYFTNDSEWFLQSAIKDFYEGVINTRIIAYRNTTIDTNNDVIRPYFYDDMEKYCPGEYIILNRPYYGEGCKLHNGTVLHITEAVEDFHTFSVDNPEADPFSVEPQKIYLKVWRITAEVVRLQNLDSEEEPTIVSVVAIHQDSEEHYEDLQQLIVEKAKNVSAGLWKDLSDLHSQNIFASRYYCVSCYKAQGQSIDNVYVMLTDILDVKDLELATMLRSIYTAVTRTKKKCIVLI